MSRSITAKGICKLWLKKVNYEAESRLQVVECINLCSYVCEFCQTFWLLSWLMFTLIYMLNKIQKLFVLFVLFLVYYFLAFSMILQSECNSLSLVHTFWGNVVGMGGCLSVPVTFCPLAYCWGLSVTWSSVSGRDFSVDLWLGWVFSPYHLLSYISFAVMTYSRDSYPNAQREVCVQMCRRANISVCLCVISQTEGYSLWKKHTDIANVLL